MPRELPLPPPRISGPREGGNDGLLLWLLRTSGMCGLDDGPGPCRGSLRGVKIGFSRSSRGLLPRSTPPERLPRSVFDGNR
ncbi:MAG: hypothetical protein ACRD4I_03480 [Candidatus Angelobacter sp.]